MGSGDMANGKELIRFRCYQCGKLLGTSASRAGRTTICPNCKADLIVPEPDDPERAALAEATRSLVPNLDEPPRPREPEPGPRPQHDPQFSWEEIDTAIFQAPGGPSPIDLGISLAPPEPVAPPEPEAEPEPPVEPLPPPEPVPSPATSPIPPIAPPEIAVEVAPIRGDRAARRRPGDVVLSQSVITSWAIFMLLALGISFIAGLFVGHFVWKG